MGEENKETGDVHSCSHEHENKHDRGDDNGEKMDQTTSLKIPSTIINFLMKLAFPFIGTLALTFMGYYLNANYMPRKETEEKYVKKYEYEQIVKEISDMRIKMVDKDLYEAKVEYITQSLERIEKSLQENNKDTRETFREILRTLPKNNP